MPHTSTTHGYDPRYMHPVNESYRPSHSGWGIDVRPLPAHRRVFVGNKEKFSTKLSSIPGRYLVKIKSFVQRTRRSWGTQWSRPPTSPRHITTVAPSSSTATFVLLCTLWYSTSALANNTGKTILMQFRYPITFTIIQFAFVAAYCLLLMTPMVRFSTLRAPTKAIFQTTLPMGMFQVIGHVFASIAISRIPVSTVHTIKALSPMFTVAAYALFFGVSYSSKTYMSLVPLTLGVMLACSFDISASNIIGILAAFGSAIVFVSQNIFFKKVVPSNNGGSSPRISSQKLDKLNLLLYCSSVGLALTIPLWLYYELGLLISANANPTHIKHPKSGHDTPHSLGYYIFLNGTVNFTQNIIAFVILGRTSPVTYSIASLIKRVAVICIAIVWFNQSVHPVQGLGILMTFAGLYMYNNAKGDVEKGEKKMRRVAADRGLMLPTTVSEPRVMVGSDKAPQFGTSVIENTGTMAPGSAYPRTASSVTSHTLHHPYSIPQPHPFPGRQLQPPVNAKQPPKNLNIRITSPMASYPSPPSSVGSPPLDPVPLDDFSLYETNQERFRPVVVVA